MPRLRPLAFSLLGLLGACSVQADDPAATSAADIVTAFVPAVCAAPVASADGSSALIVNCSTSRPTLELMAVATGQRRKVHALAPGDEIGGVGPLTNGSWFAWTTKHPGGDWDVTISRFDDPTRLRVVKPSFPAGASLETTKLPRDSFRTVFTERYLVLLPGGSEQAFVVVAELASDAAPTTLNLAGPRTNLRLLGDERRILVLPSGLAQIGDAPMQTVSLEGSVPRIDPPIAIDESMRITRAEHTTFDGRLMFVSGVRASDSERVVGVLHTLTGAIDVLPSPVWGVELFGVRDKTVWYSGRLRGSVPPRTIVERVELDRPDARVRLFETEGTVTARMSREATTLLLVEGAVGPKNVHLLAADGATPPRLVHSGVTLQLGMGASGGRYLATMNDRSVLLDEVTGAIAASYPSVYLPTLSGDGTTIYARRRCDLGDIEGREIVRYHGDERVVVPCRASGGGGPELVPIPGSSSVFHLHPSAGSGRAELTLLRL